jgi:curved DNA-binding protein CbpA
VTHYEVLGVDPEASASAIRRAYLAKARRVHPDYHADADAATRARAEREMRLLNAAWEVVGDERRRAEYDDGLRIEARRVVRERPTGGPSPEFVPYSDDDTDYAALLDEAGPGNGATIPRAVQLAPALLLGIGLFGLSVGLVTAIPAVLAVGIACVLLSGIAFVLTPALAVMRSLESDRD